MRLHTLYDVMMVCYPPVMKLLRMLPLKPRLTQMLAAHPDAAQPPLSEHMLRSCPVGKTEDGSLLSENNASGVYFYHSQ